MHNKNVILGLSNPNGTLTEAGKFQKKYKIETQNALFLYQARKMHHLSSGILLAALLDNASESFIQAIAQSVSVKKEQANSFSSIYTIACQFVYILLKAKKGSYTKGHYISLLSNLEMPLQMANKEVCKIEKSVANYKRTLQYKSEIKEPCLATLNELSILVDIENMLLNKGNNVFDYAYQQRSPKSLKSLDEALSNSFDFVITKSSKFKSFDVVTIASLDEARNAINNAYEINLAENLKGRKKSNLLDLASENTSIFNNVKSMKACSKSTVVDLLEDAISLGFCGYSFVNGSIIKYGKPFSISNTINKSLLKQEVNEFLINLNSTRIHQLNLMLASMSLAEIEVFENGETSVGINLTSSSEVKKLESKVKNMVQMYHQLNSEM